MARFLHEEGARVYGGFRDRAGAAGRVREDPPDPTDPELPGELELQSRWFAGEFGDGFRSTCGREVRIRQFGHWNRGGGPDFSDCAIDVDGEVLAGGIELDPDATDWEAHGHGGNPAFDDVVLHVFFRGPGAGRRFFTRTSRHREVVQVHISSGLPAAADPPRRMTAGAHVGRCAVPFAEMSGERVDSLLEAAAQLRVREKSRRLRRVAHLHGEGQALYQGLAEALGYRHNRLSMRILAQRLPVGELAKLPDLAAEARLFGHAGFLRAAGFDRYSPPTRGYLRGLWDEWWKEREEDGPGAMELPAWRIAGVRPGNHPERRLGALAAILRRWNEVRKAADESPAAAAALLATIDHPFWSDRYTLRSRPAARPVALLGKGRIAEILANVLYPIALDRSPDHWRRFTELPARGGNEKLRRATVRLFGGRLDSARFQRFLYQQQGLLQIYRDFCLEDDSGCDDCPFPEQLADWEREDSGVSPSPARPSR